MLERPVGAATLPLSHSERWLTQRLDAGEDISADVERLLREGSSAALVSVLLSVAKYRPSLLTGPLAALLTFPNLFHWDSARVDQVGYNFIGWSWLRSGEAMFDFARDWTLAPHRQRKFLDVVVEVLLADDNVAQCLQELLPTWALPEDPKEALEFKLLFVALDRVNHHTVTDPVTGRLRRGCRAQAHRPRTKDPPARAKRTKPRPGAAHRAPG